jgi:hypothetical protein
LPPDWSVAGAHSPDISSAIPDYRSALAQTLRAISLPSGLREGSRVAIVVDDASRWTPVLRGAADRPSVSA